MTNQTQTDRLAEAPTLSDEWIAERWPDENADEIRRRFDALMAKLGETPWRGVPRFPEAMQPVLAWAAMLPSERVELLTAALADVPEHFRDYLYVAEKPMFGEQRVKMMSVAGDSGHGMGRQAVAITPYVKGYNIAPWIAAASPGNVGALLGYLQSLSNVESENARLREALGRIAKGEVEEFDSDLQRTVTLSMCESEMKEIASAALAKRNADKPS